MSLQSCWEGKISGRKLESCIQTLGKHLETEIKCGIVVGLGVASNGTNTTDNCRTTGEKERKCMRTLNTDS